MKLSELQLLKEAREGYLYHATAPLLAGQILASNTMLGKTIQAIPGQIKKKIARQFGGEVQTGDQRGVSLTRDLRFAKNWAAQFGNEEIKGVIFVLDQAKLYQDYGKRLTPLDYYQITDFSALSKDHAQGGGLTRRTGTTAEAEEFLIGDLHNVKNYIVSVILISIFDNVQDIANEWDATFTKAKAFAKSDIDKLNYVLKYPKLTLYNPNNWKLSRPQDIIKESSDLITLYHGTCNVTPFLEKGWTPGAGLVGGNAGQTKYLYCTTEYEDAMWFANEKGCDKVVKISDVPMSSLIVDPEDGVYDTVEEELAMAKRTGGPAKLAITKPLSKEHFSEAKIIQDDTINGPRHFRLW